MKSLHQLFVGQALSRDALFAVVRIVLLYAIFAGLWILLSDSLVARVFPAPSSIHIASTLKGLVFVAVTSVLLFFLILRLASQGNGSSGGGKGNVGAGGTASAPLRRGLAGGIVLLSGIFILLGAGGILQSLGRHRAEASAHLQSIAQLKVAQIEGWLNERRRDAQMVRGAYVFSEALPQWRKTGDPVLRARLLARLDSICSAMHYDGIWLSDPEGNLLLRSGAPEHVMSDELHEAVRRAVASGQIVVTDLFRDVTSATEHVHLDVVAPLLPAPGEAQAAGVVILRIDVDATLYAFLSSWPIPSDSAESLLFRRDGESVLFLNELRHEKNTALLKRVPLTDTDVLAVRALVTGYRSGGLIEGVDYRGIPVMGVVLPIAGTSWWLVAKADRQEILAAVRSDALWIVIASLLVLLATVSLAVLVYQRRELQHAHWQHHEQAERLRTLQLLDAIIGSSTDAIFAKDSAGRYLLFNNEAARLTGKTQEEVIGCDDRTLFPPEQAKLIMANDHAVIENRKTVTVQEKLTTADGEVMFLATKGPLFDAEGRVFGLFGISRDITKLKQVEDALQRQTGELLARNAELERFNSVVVGRELEMIELKRLVNALSRELGRTPPYPLDFVGSSADGTNP